MTDSSAVVAAPAVPVAPKPPKKKLAASKTAVAAHPSTAIMVTAAITELKDKKGSTLQGIKKYMAANYQVEPTKMAPFIRKFLKAAVTKGLLVQTKGTGASGLFKLAEVKKPVKKVAVKKPAAKKSITVKAPGAPKKRKLTAKKPKGSEPATKKAKKAVAVPKPKLAKSPAKTKKTPATKTKPPKSKKTPVKKTTVIKKK